MIRARLLSPFVAQTLTGFTVQPRGDDLHRLAELAEAGELTPVVDRTCPLAEVAEALGHLETGHTRGKVVLVHPAAS
jgi:NADPH:quinone reductase-like Zn-dependent oxidoreductase